MLRSPWWCKAILAVTVLLMNLGVAGSLRAQSSDSSAAPGKVFLHQGCTITT